MGAFWCVNDGVPPETTDLLQEACGALEVPYREIDAASFSFDPAGRLTPGAMLFRPAASFLASSVEQFLFAPGVATFNTRPDGVYFECVATPFIFEAKGLPIPPSFPVSSPGRELLRRQVAALGGFPVVLKALGGSNGVGTMRADSHPALFSLVDMLLDAGELILLCRYIPDSVQWRVIVVGPDAVAAYPNVQARDDFRSQPPSDPSAFTSEVPPRLARLAASATHALELEFGGVDILEAGDGALYLLEVNYPCYFAEAQLTAGIDVAGAMVRHLRAKVERLKA